MFRQYLIVQSVCAFYSCLFPSAAACSSVSLPPQLGSVLWMARVPSQTSHLRTAAGTWQNQPGTVSRCCESHKHTCSPEEATGMQLAHLFAFFMQLLCCSAEVCWFARHRYARRSQQCSLVCMCLLSKSCLSCTDMLCAGGVVVHGISVFDIHCILQELCLPEHVAVA